MFNPDEIEESLFVVRGYSYLGTLDNAHWAKKTREIKYIKQKKYSS